MKEPPFFFGIVGSVVTIALTVWNAETKRAIDTSQQELSRKTADLDAEIRRRNATVEESKERVERFKWVYELLPALTDPDKTKRNATLAMVRLALNKEEAETLLAGLQQSPSAEVRQAAKQGLETISAIESEEVVRLVDQMNANSSDDRRRATGRLQRDFADSPYAIGLVLERLSKEKVQTLTPNGLINAMFFLSRTDPQVWTPKNVRSAEAALQKRFAHSRLEHRPEPNSRG